MSMIINEQKLQELLKDPTKNIVVLDVRYELGNENAGKKAYAASHIPGAFYIDIKKDLSGEVKEHGGNHPLPAPQQLMNTLGSLGIDQDTIVVIYDTGGDMFAARAWFTLTYVGHENVYVLDGGFKAWTVAGNEVTSVIPKPKEPKAIQLSIRTDWIVPMETVKENIETAEATLIDSRSRERYLGRTEPLYDQAGHIPGAKNFFWKNVFNKDGTWKSKQELQDYFSSLTFDEKLIISCGSGVSACVNLIALLRAGYQDVTLYAGSFSDWISYPHNPLQQVKS